MEAETNRKTRWRLADWKRKAIFAAVVVVVCFGYALSVIGSRVLNPLNLTWLTGDAEQAYLGWAFFRQESHLTFPLGWSHSLGYPLGEPVAYTDSMPIVAVFSWCVAIPFGHDFQYLGAYFLICCILQFYFGYRITRRLCSGNIIAGALGAGFFLTAPPFTWRAYGHFALASHWLILAALDQFTAGSNPPSPLRTVWRGMLCFVAAGISPYIAAMTLLVMVATYSRPLLNSRRYIVPCLSGMGFAVICMGLGLVLFGFVGSTDIAQYAAADYSNYSMNLLAPIDPGATGALLLKQQPTFWPQYEGNNYLGLGVLLLGIASLARAPSSFKDLFQRTNVPAGVVVLISLLGALSTKITLGHHILYEAPVPRLILPALQAFHASGRLFWPGYYLMFIAIISVTFRAFRKEQFTAILGVALMIQFADIAPLRAAIHLQLQSYSAALVPSGAEWNDLGRRQRHLVLLPAWQCSPSGPDWTIFGRLALQQQMTINSLYAARYSAEQSRFFCLDQYNNVEQDGLRSDTVYVLRKGSAGLLAGLEYGENYCRYTDNYVLCSRTDDRTGVDPAILNGLQLLRPGDTLDFATGSATANNILTWGWSVPEHWGRWAQGHLAVAVFRLPPASQDDIVVDISVVPFLSPSRPSQHVEVLANNKPVAHLTFQEAAVSNLHLVIPKQVIKGDGVVRLVFRMPDAISPAAVGQSGDMRPLSIGLIQLRLNSGG